MMPVPSLTAKQFDATGRRFRLGRTLVMGILNVTPDSFSDGGRFSALEAACAQAEIMAAEGADIVDVGGESTRPGAQPVSSEIELSRVLPVLARVASALPCPISIDTYKASVAEPCLRAGARIVNDVWGLQRDPEMAGVVATNGAAVIVMHNRESVDASIEILSDVLRFLERSLAIAHRAGIDKERIVVDPGIGFGKTLEQNLLLIAQLGTMRDRLGCPVLLGASRKSLIDRISPAGPLNRLGGTLALHTAGVLAGADILRVHDVAEGVQAARLVDRLREYWNK